MRHVLVEELVNLRHYNFALSFDLPLQISMSAQIKITARVETIKQVLRPEGLFLNGTVYEELSITDGGEYECREERFHFTYLIPPHDLKEANLLNFELTALIEQIHYHLIKKDGQVILLQKLQMKLTLYEYHLENKVPCNLGGLQKQSGFLQKKTGEVEHSLLRIYPVELPGDFALLRGVTGRVEQERVELTPDGCILEYICRLQCEYVTDGQKIGTFFFKKNEYMFFPYSNQFNADGEAHVQINLKDLSLENDAELTVLYVCKLQFYHKNEIFYYTCAPDALPAGAEVKRIEVEQVGQQLVHSEMVDETLELAGLDVVQVVQVSGVLEEQTLEETGDKLFLSGVLEVTIFYFDTSGIERSYLWSKRVDTMLPYTALPIEGRGYWRMEAAVQVPTWEVRTGQPAENLCEHSGAKAGVRANNVAQGTELVPMGESARVDEPEDVGDSARIADVVNSAEQTQISKSRHTEEVKCNKKRTQMTVEAITFNAVLDYQVTYYIHTIEPVLTLLPSGLDEVRYEELTLTEELYRSEVTVQGEENAYLTRYARQITEISGWVKDWQVRVLEGGWMVRGVGDIEIYFLDREGERHYSQPFRFYQYIPDKNISPEIQVRLTPRVQILGEELLEDGSLVRVQYLVHIEYALFRQTDGAIVTHVESTLHTRVRPVLESGQLSGQIKEMITLEERFMPLNRIKEINQLHLDWRDYRVALTEEEFRLTGEVDVEIRYAMSFGKERSRRLTLPVQFLENMTIKGEPHQQIRAVPEIKGYDYRLADHPSKDGQIELSILLVVNYRLIGTESNRWPETFPFPSTT